MAPVRQSPIRRVSLAVGILTLAVITWAEAVPLESWDQQVTTPNRFELVLGGAAVLDQETQLVWEQNPGGTGDWAFAVDRCYRRTVGTVARIGGIGRVSPGRKGWRLPTVEELASLVDPTQELPALPSGHPFEIGTGFAVLGFWTHTTSAADRDQAYVVNFGTGGVFTETKQASLANPLPSLGEAWCVRGGHGHDGGH
jgi:Protein of unknown function (DUF1566)